MIIVFTGNGKGKTTAALGQAIRALGQGKRVLMVQFIKGEFISGEHKFLKMLPASWQTKFQIIKSGKGFVKISPDKFSFEIHRKAALKALDLAKKGIDSKNWDLIILDEINMAANLKLIKVNEVLKILKKLPSEKVLVLTGRGAPKIFIQKADLVTEMKEIKHPFQKGKVGQLGIEF